MPDELITRLAKVEQRVDHLDQRLSDMAGVKEALARMTSDLQHLDGAVKDVHDDIETVNKALAARDSAVSQERRQTRVALWSLVGVLGASLITAIGAYLAAGATP